ncbi:hypothetical protein CVU82_02695 [Candidatus Falkowbacteria bacterium HGW-Falkowbacteria-1]|jgi:hypothetical protein|uniref:Uncharacterized protein n=1 Tax=Candidatus Falkowbacteria bacterium HGW-Falkowbacteria-1 TaxID=2013768 RepID=A0A2N2E9R7_9BACT|nr:MAG: hypothetical protein CVU82_02695 [Candidatus Falkowbacteria bacterium HGW-Falkowbacteria-1]
MKKYLFVFFPIFASFFFLSCSNQGGGENIVEQKYEELMNDMVEGPEDLPIQIIVSEIDFKKSVDFIEKKGFVVPQGEECSDYQYTFFDKAGNRYALMTIRRDDDGKASLNGVVNQISVWAYRDGIKDQEHFFGFCINKNEINSFGERIPDEDVEIIEEAWREFLKEVWK